MFYFNEEIQVDTFSYTSLAPGNPLEGYAFQIQNAESFALFGSLNFHLGEKVDLQAGLRYSADEKKLSAERPFPVFQTPTFAPIVEEVDDTDVSGDLSLTFKASDTVNIYGRVATGYRAPSIQGRILFCPDFEGGQNPATNCVTTADTEKIISGEIGIKTILADSKVRLNLTGYMYEVDGQQLSAVGGEFNTATLLNADKTNGHGIEADMQWTPSGNWLMTFGYSWNPTEINDENLTVAPCGGGCTVTNPVVGGLAFIDGNALPHAPEHIFNGIINFRSHPVNKGFIGSFDWAYYSEKNFFLYESEEFKADSLEFGLRLGYGWNQGKYEVAAWGRNITNAEIARGGIDFINLTGMVNEPQIIGVEFVANF
jgi:iron complex outermembrane receptor protein